jgi:hypothetical protein
MADLSLSEVLAEMREHRLALDAADFTGQHIIICKILVKLPEWAAALAKYERLVKAAEALALYAQEMRNSRDADDWEDGWLDRVARANAMHDRAQTAIECEALALFAKEGA